MSNLAMKTERQVITSLDGVSRIAHRYIINDKPMAFVAQFVATTVGQPGSKVRNATKKKRKLRDIAIVAMFGHV